MKQVVNAIILDKKKEKVLLIKRIGGIHSDKWAFPGGVVEKGETEEVALKREVREELGIEVSRILKKIGSYEYPGENKENTFGSSFLVSIKEKKININKKEISEFGWFTPEDIELIECAPGIQEEAIKAIYG